MPEQNEIVIFQHGEYSDFRYHGPFKVLVNFSVLEQFKNWCGHEPPVFSFDLDDNYGMFVESAFIGWLNQQGFIEDLNAKEIYLGAYSRFENQGDWD